MALKAKKHVAEPKRVSKTATPSIGAWFAEWWSAHSAVREAERRVEAGGLSPAEEATEDATIRIYSDVKHIVARRILTTNAATNDDLAIQAHLIQILLVPDRQGHRDPFLLAALPTYLGQLAYSVGLVLRVDDVKHTGEVRYSKAKG